MSNIRTIFDNAIERATLSSSPAGTGVMTALNLAGGRKSRSWRAAALLATVNALWPAGAEPLQAVVWPVCNFSPTSEQRVRVSTEDSAVNLAKGSQTLSNPHGWSGASVIASAITLKGVVPYVEIKKTLATANENRALSFGAVGIGSVYTFTIALRAAGSTSVTLGLYDGAAWGATSDSTASIIEGPGSISRATGAMWNVNSLSTGSDTLVRITRTFTAACTGSIMIYPGMSSSTNTTHSVLATRVQVETGPVWTSYYPATTAAATRPAGYIDSWQSYQYDSGFVPANYGAPARKIRGFTAAQAAGAYFNGGGTSAWHWLPTELQARGLSVTVRDPDNLQGYIEAPFLVAGAYWEASYNPTKVPMGILDRTTIGYSRGGDQWADASDVRRTLDIELAQLAMSDRADMVEMLTNSRAYPILVAVFPDDPDPALVRDNMIYGRRSRDSDISPDTAFTLSMSIPLEEV